MNLKNFIIIDIFVIAVILGILYFANFWGKAKLVVATDPNWPPMEFINEKGNIVGFDIDLLNAIAEKGGFTVVVTNVDWKGIFEGLLAGNYDAVIADLTITEERKLKYDFSFPYYNAGQVILAKNADTNLTNLAALAGKRVGLLSNSSAEAEVKKTSGILVHPYDNIRQAVEDLYTGKLDAVVAGISILANSLRNERRYLQELSIVSEALTLEYSGIAVRKGDAKTLELINKGLKEVLYNKMERVLEEKWLR